VTAPPRFLLWDFDGTLAYRPGQWTDTVMGILRRAGFALDLDREAIRPFMNRGFPWHEPERVRLPGQSADDWWQALQPVLSRAVAHVPGIDPDRAAQLAAEVRSTFLDHTAWIVFDDVRPTLEQLRRRGWRHVVLSNHVPELPELMSRLGLLPLFDDVHTSATMGVEKPNVKAFQHARSRLAADAVVWMIGDNPVADVAGAEAAGIPAILVRARTIVPGIERCCASVADVIDIIESIPPALTG
jgi:putative hydrolase of the HAD superfamily